jgi:hypothetical protein
MQENRLEERIAALEKRVRRLTTALTCLLALTLFTASVAWAPRFPDVLRAHAIILSDGAGRDRILIGAPIPEPAGARIAPSIGMAIRDSTGAERFGVGVFPSGNVIMGFDAPQPPGSHGNPERINIVAGSDGLANIRFLNRKSSVAGYLQLSDDENLYLQMTAVSSRDTVWRQVGAVNDTIVRRP